MSARLSININDRTATELRELTERRKTTITEEIRRAVITYKFILDETDNGKTLQLLNKDGSVSDVVMVG